MRDFLKGRSWAEYGKDVAESLDDARAENRARLAALATNAPEATDAAKREGGA